MADNPTAFLKQQWGPMPAGVWIIVIAGSLGVAYYLNRNGGLLSAGTEVPTRALNNLPSRQQASQGSVTAVQVAGSNYPHRHRTAIIRNQ